MCCAVGAVGCGWPLAVEGRGGKAMASKSNDRVSVRPF